MSSTYFFLSSPLCLKSQIFFLAFFIHRRIFFRFNEITWGEKKFNAKQKFYDVRCWYLRLTLELWTGQKGKTSWRTFCHVHRQENMKFACSRMVLNSPSLYYLEKCSKEEINILLSWLKRKCHSLYILCTTFLRSSVQLSCRSFIWMIANQLWFFF